MTASARSSQSPRSPVRVDLRSPANRFTNRQHVACPVDHVFKTRGAIVAECTHRLQSSNQKIAVRRGAVIVLTGREKVAGATRAAHAERIIGARLIRTQL